MQVQSFLVRKKNGKYIIRHSVKKFFLRVTTFSFSENLGKLEDWELLIQTLKHLELSYMIKFSLYILAVDSNLQTFIRIKDGFAT